MGTWTLWVGTDVRAAEGPPECFLRFLRRAGAFIKADDADRCFDALRGLHQTNKPFQFKRARETTLGAGREFTSKEGYSSVGRESL